ncbi:MAG: LamG domain-containing protein, partial [bacterium]
MNVITYGYVPDDFITPPSPVTAYKGQWGLDETTSTDTNQFKASGYLDTGKLGQAVSMYGNAAGTAGSTLTFNRGAQISGNNYEHINTNQGTVSFWFKPLVNLNDNQYHFFLSSQSTSGYPKEIIISKNTSNNEIGITINDGSGFIGGYVTTTLTVGTWYHAVGRWSINTVDGVNVADFRINNGTPATGAGTYSAFVPGNRSFIGSYVDNAYSANSLIDDFAIFDRVLTAAEITSLYNAGTGNEAGYVADSSLKFYAKMDGSGTLQPVTYNGGVSASKMTRTSSELTNGTNLVTDGNMELSGTSNFYNYNTAPTFEKVTGSSVLLDTQSLHVVADGSATQGAQVGFGTRNAGENYHISLWVKTTGTNKVQIVIGGWFQQWLNPSGSSGDSYTNWTRIEGDFKVITTGANRVWIASPGSVATEFYVDNITVTPNLVDNGGMEVAGATPP